MRSPKRAAADSPAPGSKALGRIVRPDGPTRHGTPLILGEAPGVDELSRGRNFVGRSGQELWRYFDGHTLPERDQFRVANCCWQFPIKKKPNAEEIAYWRPRVQAEIDRIRPELIVALGATAAQWLLGPDISVERTHGLAHRWNICFACAHAETARARTGQPQDGLLVPEEDEGAADRPAGKARRENSSTARARAHVQVVRGRSAGGPGVGSSVPERPVFELPARRAGDASGERVAPLSIANALQERPRVRSSELAVRHQAARTRPSKNMQGVQTDQQSALEACGTCGATLFSCTVLTCFHPAAALHNPDLQSLFAYDMGVLATGLRKGFTLRVPDRISPRYELLPRGVRIPHAFSVDTEGSKAEPYCVTISWEPGVAYMVKASDEHGLKQLREAFQRAERITCHSLLFDLDVLAAMGLTVPDGAMQDTQVAAYNLGLEPQGLKDLAYRWLGAEQADYSEIVAPAEELMHAGYIDVIRKTHDNPRVVKACERVLAKLGTGVPAKKLWRGSKFSKVVPPVPRVTLDNVPAATARTYACRDADLTERLVVPLTQQIEKCGLERVHRLDMAVIPIVHRMERVGMRVLPEHFRGLVERFDKAFIAKHAEIARLVGFEVNPNSAPQVAALLYDRLHLPHPKKRTIHGFSTQDKYLEAMRGLHAVMPLIIDARELTKLKSAYAAAILDSLKVVREDGETYYCIFPHLRITRVISGRVSAFDPNVLAIPKHSELGRLIRLGFVAGPGRVLLSVDLSQIELRVAAHECRDRAMMKVFVDGKDLHAALGEKIFGVKAALQDESLHRLPMKKANFGYWMGISAAGMRDQLHAAGALKWTEADCAKIMHEMDRVWPGAPAYKDNKIAQARRLGYVTDFLGRRRYLAGVHSPDNRVRAEAERQAHATPIQAGAQEVFKTWMSSIWKEVLKPNYEHSKGYAEPWLQVHDCVMLEVAQSLEPKIRKRALELIPQMLRVPIAAKATTGQSWGEVG